MGENKKNITIILFIIIVLLTSILLYFIFTRKTEDNSNKDNLPIESNNDNKIINNDNNTDDNTNIADPVVYKTTNGKKQIKVIDIRDADTRERAKTIRDNLGVNDDITEFIDGTLDSSDYFIEYGNELIIADREGTGKYYSFTGDKIGEEGSQCGTYSFMVNTENNQLLDLDYNNEYLYNIILIGNSYYIERWQCPGTQMGLYNEKLERIADFYLTKNNKNAFYAIKDNAIIKYDEKGNILQKGKSKLSEDDISDYINYGNTLYLIVKINNKVYLLNNDTNEKYELETKVDYEFCPISDEQCGGSDLKVYNNKLRILFNPFNHFDVYFYTTYLFDVKSKRMENIGEFLLDDKLEKYFYVIKNSMMAKYDTNANLVNEIKFSEKELYENSHDSSMWSYDGNFFILINDNNKLYLKNIYDNKQYEIVDLTKYDYYGTSYYEEINGSSTSKLKITLQDKKNSYQNKNVFEYWYFDMNTKTLSNKVK